MIDPNLVKIFVIIVVSGSVGSALALIPLIFKKWEEGPTGYGTTAGVGFLIGASLGGLVGIFAVLLGQV